MKLELVIEAGRHDRRRVPVSVPLPAGVTDRTFTLNPGDIPGQNVGGELAFLLDRIEAGSSLALTASPASRADAVTVAEHDDTLAFADSGKPVTIYHFGDRSPLPIPSKPFFYPLNLDGVCLTRKVAARSEPEPKIDHPHHRSLWVAHGDLNGVNIWDDGEGHGFQRHVAFGSRYGGPVCGGFTETVRWETKDGKPVIEDERSFRLWRSASGEVLLDLAVTFHAAHGPVKFGDTKEGGICALRVREPLQGDRTGLMTHATGAVTEPEIWGHRSPWIDYSGELDGRKTGIAVFDHPKSFRYPTHWHARDYGLFTANPFAWHDYQTGWSQDGSYTIEAGKRLPFRYRVLLHEGDGAQANVAARWLDFAFPPAVSVKT